IRPSGFAGRPQETWPKVEFGPHFATERARLETPHLPARAPGIYPEGAADKAATQLVRGQPCQSPRADMKRCHILDRATGQAMRGVNGPAARHRCVWRSAQSGGLASVGA